MADVEIVKKIYEAINQNDIPGVMKFFDPQIERIEFEGSSMEGKYRGLTEIEAHFSKARSSWAEGSCEPERMIVEGNHVIALVHVRVRLKNQSEWLEGRVADVFTFRNGKVIVFRSFSEAKDAFEWVGHSGAI